MNQEFPVEQTFETGINVGTTCGGLALYVVIFVAVAFLLNRLYQDIPPEHRKFESWMIWLMIIPVVQIIMAFLVFPKFAESYKSYFDSVGDTSVGDGGKRLAMFLCFSIALSIIPCLNFITFIVTIILLIILLLKWNDYAARIRGSAAV